ncbi:MAG TPA: transglycosylase SLT domain-containing protein [Acidimicrobiia bacterium]
MRAHRGLGVLCLLFLSIITGVGSVAAQTPVDEAERRADAARGEVDSAYEVVTGSIDNRDAVEQQLFSVLEAYGDTGARLATANAELDRIGRSMAFADMRSLDIERQLAEQTITAYMESVTAVSGLVLDTASLEDALVVGDVLGRSQQRALGDLDRLLIQQRELLDLRRAYAAERDVVSGLQSQLADRSDELQSILEAANAEVAAAFARANAADAAYRQAQSDVDRARAAEEAARRATTTTTTTTVRTSTSTTRPTVTSTAPTTTVTTAPGVTAAPTTTSSSTTTTTTTTTTTPSDPPSIPISAAVEAWRPLVTTHFAPDLVEDALVIMQCESLGDPNAVNPYSGASGLFQFMPGTWAVASVQAGVGDRSVFDGEANIIAASWLAEYYRSRGLDPWRPWTCRYYL